MANDKVLCVVNTRQAALEVYRRTARDTDAVTLHLPRMMCAAHVQDTIAAIRRILAEQPQKHLRVISTQLVEAGGDIDFPSVFRQVAGLDSILQAAGRCNREGRLAEAGTVTVFSLTGPMRGSQSLADDSLRAMRAALGDEADVMTQEAMTEYFGQLYSRVDSFDEKGVASAVKKITHVPFATVAHNFRLIDDESVDIIVPYKDGARLAEQLRAEGPSRHLMRQVRPYTVSVRRQLLEHLVEQRIVVRLRDDILALASPSQYDALTRLLTENVELEELMMV